MTVVAGAWIPNSTLAVVYTCVYMRFQENINLVACRMH